MAKMRVFTDFAASLASLSTCRRLRVGACLVDPDLTAVVAVGYNGPAAGLPNDGCRGGAGTCGCSHAEANVLVKTSGGGPFLLIVTDSPCEACAGLVLNSRRVGWVAYGREYRDRTGLAALAAGGVSAASWDEIEVFLIGAVRGRPGAHGAGA